jgi:hypothetical protein
MGLGRPTVEERTSSRLTDEARLQAVRNQLAGSEAQAQPVLASRILLQLRGSPPPGGRIGLLEKLESNHTREQARRELLDLIPDLTPDILPLVLREMMDERYRARSAAALLEVLHAFAVIAEHFRPQGFWKKAAGAQAMQRILVYFRAALSDAASHAGVGEAYCALWNGLVEDGVDFCAHFQPVLANLLDYLHKSSPAGLVQKRGCAVVLVQVLEPVLYRFASLDGDTSEDGRAPRSS